ncbi:uncharacterized protein VTP21DRAFT_950 [Calcarisporiella thermophila]|uniref:uncharacterized protein n=1 Tax=Calcarisporiella thermophila TaxID=911321 RepID=UPI0037445251
MQKRLSYIIAAILLLSLLSAPTSAHEIGQPHCDPELRLENRLSRGDPNQYVDKIFANPESSRHSASPSPHSSTLAQTLPTTPAQWLLLGAQSAFYVCFTFFKLFLRIFLILYSVVRFILSPFIAIINFFLLVFVRYPFSLVYQVNAALFPAYAFCAFAALVGAGAGAATGWVSEVIAEQAEKFSTLGRDIAWDGGDRKVLSSSGFSTPRFIPEKAEAVERGWLRRRRSLVGLGQDALNRMRMSGHREQGWKKREMPRADEDEFGEWTWSDSEYEVPTRSVQ